MAAKGNSKGTKRAAVSPKVDPVSGMKIAKTALPGIKVAHRDAQDAIQAIIFDPSAKITPEVAMEFATRVQATFAADKERSAADKRIEAALNRGIHLTRSQAEAATRVLAEANLAALACVELARRAVVYPDKADATFVAIEQIEMVNCRRLDSVAQLLGDSGFGNFESELSGSPMKLLEA